MEIKRLRSHALRTHERDEEWTKERRLQDQKRILSQKPTIIRDVWMYRNGLENRKGMCEESMKVDVKKGNVRAGLWLRRAWS